MAEFVLPFALCNTGNIRASAEHAAKKWLHHALIRRTFEAMFDQHRRIWSRPLEGVPLVRAIRFTSHAADPYADFAKCAIDRLCPSKLVRRKHKITKVPGLGMIADDRLSRSDVYQWCEFAPPGDGFVLLDVWTGGEEHG